VTVWCLRVECRLGRTGGRSGGGGGGGLSAERGMVGRRSGLSVLWAGQGGREYGWAAGWWDGVGRWLHECGCPIVRVVAGNKHPGLTVR
jgi:hypothetical protein